MVNTEMKTSYKKPATIVVPLQMRAMLMGSPDPDNVINPGEPNIPAGVNEYKPHRGGWDWDDEW